MNIDLEKVLTFLGGGGVTAFLGWLSYKNTRPKNRAEAKKMDAETESSYAKGWQEIANDLERRMKEMEVRYERRIAEIRADFQNQLEVLNKIHAEEIENVTKGSIERGKLKDDRILILEDQVKTLQTEVEKYKTLSSTAHLASMAHTVIDEVAAKVESQED